MTFQFMRVGEGYERRREERTVLARLTSFLSAGMRRWRVLFSELRGSDEVVFGREKFCLGGVSS